MLLHYIKIAVRQLLKYKLHTAVSLLCMSLGLVLFGFVDSLFELDKELTRIIDFMPQKDGNTYMLQGEEIEQILNADIEGLEDIKASSVSGYAKCYEVGKEDEPYIVSIIPVNSQYFSNASVVGSKTLNKGEIIINEKLAKRMYGDDSPIGKQLVITKREFLEIDQYLEYIDISYTIVGVAKNELRNNDRTIYVPFNENVACMVSATLSKGYRLKDVQKTLDKMQIFRSETGEPLKINLVSAVNYSADLFSRIILSFFALLIFITGVVGFMRFFIQMLDTRHRELVLRKCVGSNNKGLNLLLATEVVIMLSLVFIFSTVITELLYNSINDYSFNNVWGYFGFTFADVIKRQVIVIIFALVFCLLIILFYVRRIGGKTVLKVMKSKPHTNKKHYVLLSMQFAVSVIFCVLIGASLYSIKINSSPVKKYLSLEEMDRIIYVDWNGVEHWDEIRAELEQLPEVENSCVLQIEEIVKQRYNFREILVGSDTITIQDVSAGDPRYFELLNIPMEGKLVKPEQNNYVYVNRAIYDELSKLSGFDGTIQVSNSSELYYRLYEDINIDSYSFTTLQIAGVIDVNPGVTPSYFIDYGFNEVKGVMFKVQESPNANTCLYKIKDGVDIEDAKKSFESVYRKYIPKSMDIAPFQTVKDVVLSREESIKSLLLVSISLAFISLVMLVLSVYSTIALDAARRQKEVAIRKINGASRQDILMQTIKPYLKTYTMTFIVVYIAMLSVWGNVSDVSMPVLLVTLYGIVVYLFTTGLVALTIWKEVKTIMLVNPADAIRRE
ncbi:MAG: ABC transporter permease [Bacteroidaceae bacterium]|nr:ABC transporter permease [Bacteroidaceae bacterium]